MLDENLSALHGDHEDIEVLHELATLQSLYGGHEAAVCILTLANTLLPNDRMTIRLLARNYLKLGQAMKCITILAECLERDSTRFETADWVLMARALSAAGEFEKAKNTFEIARRFETATD